jgi:RimJ/RimL family protein N-acetyltransferase
MTKPIYLESDRLILRSFMDSDLHDFVAYRSDPKVAIYQSWHDYDLAAGRAFIAEQLAGQPNVPGTWYQIAIERRADGCLLGDLAWHTPLDQPQQAMIGYTLASQYQGMGFASEAVTCFLDFLFHRMEKHRVYAETDSRNLGSVKLLERIGFRREGHMIQSEWFKGEWVDNFYYAILGDEWRHP